MDNVMVRIQPSIDEQNLIITTELSKDDDKIAPYLNQMDSLDKELDKLEERWGKKYPIVFQSWRNKWENLTVHEKINVKQYAIDFYGKRWHTSKPNFCSKLNQLELFSSSNKMIDSSLRRLVQGENKPPSRI